MKLIGFEMFEKICQENYEKYKDKVNIFKKTTGLYVLCYAIIILIFAMIICSFIFLNISVHECAGRWCLIASAICLIGLYFLNRKINIRTKSYQSLNYFDIKQRLNDVLKNINVSGLCEIINVKITKREKLYKLIWVIATALIIPNLKVDFKCTDPSLIILQMFLLVYSIILAVFLGTQMLYPISPKILNLYEYLDFLTQYKDDLNK